MDARAVSGLLIGSPGAVEHTAAFLARMTGDVGLQRREGWVGICVNVSLAGDTRSTFQAAATESTMHTDVSSQCSNMMTAKEDTIRHRGATAIEDAMLRSLYRLADALIAAGIDIVFSQKCIHPAVRAYLVNKGLLVLERLAKGHVDDIRRLIGAPGMLSNHAFGGLADDADDAEAGPGGYAGLVAELRNQTGVVTGLAVVAHGGANRHVHIKSNRGAEVGTVLVTVADGQRGRTGLGDAIERSLKVLTTTFQATSPACFAGGGCTEMMVSDHVMALARDSSYVGGVARAVGCTPPQVIIGMRAFADSLLELPRALLRTACHSHGSGATDAGGVEDDMRTANCGRRGTAKMAGSTTLVG